MQNGERGGRSGRAGPGGARRERSSCELCTSTCTSIASQYNVNRKTMQLFPPALNPKWSSHPEPPSDCVACDPWPCPCTVHVAAAHSTDAHGTPRRSVRIRAPLVLHARPTHTPRLQRGSYPERLRSHKNNEYAQSTGLRSAHPTHAQASQLSLIHV